MRNASLAFGLAALFATAPALAAAPITRQEADQQIHACASNDAWCVGEVLLDVIFGGSTTTPPPNPAVTCTCDSSATLTCTVGSGASEQSVQGSVYVGNSDYCARDQKDIRINHRICDSSATLWRLDYPSLSFVKVAYVGNFDSCFQQIEQAPAPLAGVTCACDSSATLTCTTGAGSAEQPVQGSVYVGNSDNCVRDQKDVNINDRVCDSSATLWRVDSGSHSFVKVAYIGNSDSCFQQAEQTP